MQSALKNLFGGKAWDNWKKENKYVGLIRSKEIPWSPRAGWHPHEHVLIFTDRPWTKEEKNEVEQWFIRRWVYIAATKGWADTDETKNNMKKHGVKVKIGTETVSRAYLAKTLVWEMTSPSTKTNDQSMSLNHWEILNLASAGEPKFEARALELIKAVWGRPVIRWSPGLKKHLEITIENEETEPLFELAPEDFRRLSRDRTHAQLLEAVESQNSELIDYFIKNYGLTPVVKTD